MSDKPRSPELPIPSDPDALLTPEQVAAWTQLGVQTLANMRWRRTGPEYLKLGDGRSAPVRYRRRDVSAFLDACAQNAR